MARHPRLGVLRSIKLTAPTRVNAWLAIKLTRVVGSMWCAYAFTVLALVGLPGALKKGGEGLVPWVAQTFLQLVLLSVIMVGTNLLGSSQAAQATETHDMVKEELADVREELKLLHAKLDALNDN